MTPNSHGSSWMSLSGLLLMPVALFILSYLAQPTLLPRYAIVTSIAFVPILARILQPLSRPMVAVVCLYFFGYGLVQLADVRTTAQNEDATREQLVNSIRSHANGSLVVFEGRRDMDPAMQYAPDLAHSFYLLDFEANQVANPTAVRLHERDVARRMALYYPHYQLLNLSALARYDRVCLIPLPNRESQIGDDYDGFSLKWLSERMLELRREP